MNIDVLKQNISSTSFSKFKQYNGVTQLLATESRIIRVSATVIDQKFYIFFFDFPSSGTLDVDLTDHCVTFVKLPFSCKNDQETKSTYELFPYIYIESATRFHLQKVPNI